MRSIAASILLLGLLAPTAEATEPPAAGESAGVAAGESEDPLVAHVGDVEIHESDLNELLSLFGEEAREHFESQPDWTPFLEELASRIRISLEAERLGLDQVPAVRAEIAGLRHSTLINAYMERVVVPEVAPEDEVKAVWEERKDEFQRPLRLRVRQIVVTPRPEERIPNRMRDDAKDGDLARRKIDFLAGRLAAGVDFEELARDFSEHVTAGNGGDIGWFEEGDMVETFEAAAKALEPGEVSDVVETVHGFHILRLEGVQPAGPAPFEEVQEQLRKELISQRQQQVMERLRELSERLEKAHPLVRAGSAGP